MCVHAWKWLEQYWNFKKLKWVGLIREESEFFLPLTR